MSLPTAHPPRSRVVPPMAKVGSGASDGVPFAVSWAFPMSESPHGDSRDTCCELLSASLIWTPRVASHNNGY
jgi:hypothetical protein